MRDKVYDTDSIEYLGHSVIHHGKESDRVYLMRFNAADMPELPERLIDLAQKNNYSKIVCKVPRTYQANFERYGYGFEAEIPGYYDGNQDCIFVSRFLSSSRKKQRDADVIEDILIQAKIRSQAVTKCVSLDPQFVSGVMREQDVLDMATLYKMVFKTYPFPIMDPNYILETMKENVIYFGIRDNGKLVALSSIEASFEDSNGEMTDFATDPDYRGLGLAGHLLDTMDKEFAARKMKTAYTIARAVSIGMNLTFAGRGYCYGGTLVNNTQISGALESMNIWYKKV